MKRGDSLPIHGGNGSTMARKPEGRKDTPVTMKCPKCETAMKKLRAAPGGLRRWQCYTCEQIWRQNGWGNVKKES